MYSLNKPNRYNTPLIEYTPNLKMHLDSYTRKSSKNGETNRIVFVILRVSYVNDLITLPTSTIYVNDAKCFFWEIMFLHGRLTRRLNTIQIENTHANTKNIV